MAPPAPLVPPTLTADGLLEYSVHGAGKAGGVESSCTSREGGGEEWSGRVLFPFFISISSLDSPRPNYRAQIAAKKKLFPASA